MGMFSKKTDLSAGASVPIDQVVAMKAQGYSNNQIIQTLQRDGYSSSQIFDAISQSELTTNAPTTDQLSQQQSMTQMPQQQTQSSFYSQPASSTEELVEAIIDEKWNELVKDINKVIDWKQKADAKLSAMDQQISDMKEQFDKLHQAIIGKIGDYDKTMLDVGAELQAMEKVFSKVLPTFVDNVNELNRITENIKTPSSKVKKK